MAPARRRWSGATSCSRTRRRCSRVARVHRARGRWRCRQEPARGRDRPTRHGALVPRRDNGRDPGSGGVPARRAEPSPAPTWARWTGHPCWPRHARHSSVMLAAARCSSPWTMPTSWTTTRRPSSSSSRWPCRRCGRHRSQRSRGPGRDHVPVEGSASPSGSRSSGLTTRPSSGLRPRSSGARSTRGLASLIGDRGARQCARGAGAGAGPAGRGRGVDPPGARTGGRSSAPSAWPRHRRGRGRAHRRPRAGGAARH